MISRRKTDPRVIRTQQMLRDALMELIPQMGYDQITVQHITDRAALNRTTFYLHYKDKHDLLKQIIEMVLAELERAPALLQPFHDRSDLRLVFVHLFAHVEKQKTFYRVMLQEPSVAAYVQQMQQHIEAVGMRWLSTTPNATQNMLTPPELFISFIGAAYLSMVKWWVFNDPPYSAEYMANQFMRLALGGLQRDFDVEASIEAVEDELRREKAREQPEEK